MNTVNVSVFRSLTVEKMRGLMPFTLLADGEPIAVVSKAEDVIVISDMHPRVRIQFKAKEAMIRRGMPKPEKVS